MKKIALLVITSLAVASSAWAGQEVKETKDSKTPEAPCFKDQEFQVDLFGDWIDARNSRTQDNGGGGGIGFNYFFLKYLGIGEDNNFTSTSHGLYTFSGSLIARLPIETGHFCLAPYALGGGGFQTDGVNAGTWHVGGGLEWRATPHLGIFTEGRYTWAGDHIEDTVRVSAGVRFVF
jgi:opacity protein-like surface antigen